MGLGATIKVAMDSTGVNRGLAKIQSGFQKLGGVVKGVASSMKRTAVVFGGMAVGAGLAFKNTAKWGSELKGIQLQTGQTATEILQLRNAFKLVGIDIEDSADLMSDFQEKIRDAQYSQSGTAAEGLMRLGLLPHDFKDSMTQMEHLQLLMHRIARSEKTVGEKAFILDKIFGGPGFKMVRLAHDFEGTMERSLDNVESLGSKLDAGLLDKLHAAHLAMGRLSLEVRKVMVGFVSMLPIDAIVKALNSIDMGGVMANIGHFLRNPKPTIEYIAQRIAGVGTWVGDNFMKVVTDRAAMVGKLLGEAVASAMNLDVFKQFFTNEEKSGGQKLLEAIIRGFPHGGPGGLPARDLQTSNLEKGQRDQTRVLERIERGGAQWA